MSKYRNASTTIDAWRWLFSTEQETVPDWFDRALQRWPDIGGASYSELGHIDGPRIPIVAVDDVQVAVPGDWICRRTQDDLYVMSHDAFTAEWSPA